MYVHNEYIYLYSCIVMVNIGKGGTLADCQTGHSPGWTEKNSKAHRRRGLPASCRSATRPSSREDRLFKQPRLKSRLSCGRLSEWASSSDRSHERVRAPNFSLSSAPENDPSSTLVPSGAELSNIEDSSMDLTFSRSVILTADEFVFFIIYLFFHLLYNFCLELFLFLFGSCLRVIQFNECIGNVFGKCDLL